ncbi:MAG: DUF1015 domain-containing protein [Planctomycetota bacterium]|nr:MAG: DUF1015 domain-containing protein [Planctomycetota bacterium]
MAGFGNALFAEENATVMVSIRPARRLLVPVDSDAAQQIIGPNYDEFQSDREVWELIRRQPHSILRVTMPHCDVPHADAIGAEGDERMLARAAANLRELIQGPLTRTLRDALFIYEIRGARNPQVRQIGLGGMFLTDEIRREERPQGVVIRNEGIREAKARGRARLIEHTRSLIGIVNLAVEDPQERFATLLEEVADRRAADFAATDEAGNRHAVWLVDDPGQIGRLQAAMAAIPLAFVADGNHRSAAAALLGLPEYLAVAFTTSRMGLAPYNRLVRDFPRVVDDWPAALGERFEVRVLGDLPAFRPERVHRIGFYADRCWLELTPRDGVFDPRNAVESIDAEIVQRHVFDAVMGITDPKDERLTFVGGNRDSAYLKQMVDSGAYRCAISLAPVTMEQFVAVCKQNRFMPPKSTWFDPKIRSGLVIALLDEAG